MNKLFQSVAIGMAFLCGIANVQSAPQSHSQPGKDYDVRSQQNGKGERPSSEQQMALSKLQAKLPAVRVDFNKVTGSARLVSARDGFLTGPNGQGRGVSSLVGGNPNDPDLPTKAFLAENRGLFGHGPEALSQARVVREYTTTHNGMRTVAWQQEVDGVPVFEALLLSHTTRNGELVSISSGFLPDPNLAADNGGGQRKNLVVAPPVRAETAVRFAAKNLGDDVAEDALQPATKVAGAELKQRFHSDRLLGETAVSLVWLPLGKQEARLCWDVVLKSKALGKLFRMLVDAQTGEVRLRRCLTRDISNASYNVYTNDSPTPFSPGYSTPIAIQPPTVSRTLMTLAALDTNASPAGWINDGVNETLGNNVDAHTDSDISPDVQDLPRPQGSPFRVFNFPLDLAQDPTNYSSAAVVQLFYLCNWMHDKLYQLGFTEAAGNFQTDNFGRGGVGGDPLLADAQDGGGLNNANMETPPDGMSPRMQMYIFNGPIPRRDGDLDAEIVLHEYTHGLSGRLVGGGDAVNRLQAAGMGEGWSDFYALALLSAAADNVNSNYAAGAYASYRLGGSVDLNNYYYGIRRYPYTTDMNKNPLTFKDIDPAQADNCDSGAPYHANLFGSCSTVDSDEVHAMGEVWCVTLWGARANLISKYGWGVGNNLILQLVTDGMKLCPPEPDFLEARDAILQADLVNTGGQNQSELWAAFAKRGMGYSATSPSSLTSADVLESFDLPDDLRVSPLGRVRIRGDVGGPFSQPLTVYTLTNVSGANLNWATINTAAWLEVSSSSGTLPPGGKVNVAVALSSAADSLGSGAYAADIIFTNRTSGKVQSRNYTLRLGVPDYFTELFDLGTNDLAYQSWTFTPDGSPSFYSVCRMPANSFPTDPTGGNVIVTDDDTNMPVTLSGGSTVALYNRRTNVFFIGSNGYLTMELADSGNRQNFVDYFEIPRISGLYNDLNPADGGTISWKQTSNLVAVTYSNVPLYETAHTASITNSFQVELFYDGRIRITHLNVGVADGMIGLSAGAGVPADFMESDFSQYGNCSGSLSLQLPVATTEGSGILAGQGHVRIPTALVSNLPVTLVSFDTNKLIVPATATILAGQTNVDFNLTVVNNALLDGSQPALVTASANGYNTVAKSMIVNDNEVATLSLSLPASVSEGAGSISATLSVSAVPVAPLTVQLSSSDITAIQVPAAVVIPAGQTSTVFTVTVVDDALLDGLQLATITAHIPNWSNAVATISVSDDENPNNQSLSFFNNSPVTIPSSGSATPYPANITVTGVTGIVTKVTATLSNLSHTYPEDLDILLVGPTSSNVFLMSDAGYSNSLSGVTLTFDDNATNDLPYLNPIPSGVYRPTNYYTTSGTDAFVSPAPAAPYGAALAVFKGQNPNGQWQLFIRDDAAGDGGSLTGGWSLKLDVLVPPVPVLLNPVLSSNQVTLRFNSATGFSYNVLYKDTITDAVWQLLQTVSGDGTLKTVPDFVGTNHSRYYRLEMP